MNIYLTSYGVDSRYSEYMNSYNDIIDVLRDKRVAIIPNAKLVNQDRTNSEVVKEEFQKHNIISDITDIDKETIDLNNYDALYLSGGEPKWLMDSINNANLLEIFKTFIDNGGIIVGQSAGAMIFCKDYYDTTTGKLLIMHNGFNYSDKMIVPHFDSLSLEIKEKIKDDALKIHNNDNLIKMK